MNRVWKFLALAVGLALFGWYLAQADLRAVASALAALGWFAPLILLPYLAVYIIDCLGWICTLPPGKNIPFLTLLRIRWSGESVNNVLPSAYIGGEAVKVYLLQKRGISPEAGALSAVVSKTAQTVAQFLFILVASILFYRVVGAEPGLRIALLLIILGGLAALGVLFWIQRIGLFQLFLRTTTALRIRLAALESRRAQILALDQSILGFYRRDPKSFYASTAFYFCGWFLDTVEIILVAHFLDVPITLSQALVMEAFTGVAKVLGMWVPGSLGVQESGILLLGRLAGLPETFTAAYALIRRARELVFVAAGMLFLYLGEATLRTLKSQFPAPAQ